MLMGFNEIVSGIVSDPDIVARYNEDALGMKGGFEGVFRPQSEGEVVEFVRECAGEGVAVTAQGLRSSLTGASICDCGIALSLERMNRVLDIDPKRRRALVEPGVIVSDLKAELVQTGLFYPPDPTSAWESTMGGNVATNASGSLTLRYGATADWVRGIRAVDGRGRVIVLREIQSEKHCAGYSALYNPGRLLIGSEGTLGIITQVEVSLLPPQPETFLGMVFFPRLDDALRFIIEARSDPAYTPSSIEFFDEVCLDLIRPRAEGIAVPEDAAAMLYFEQEHGGEEERDRMMETWFELIGRHSSLADDTQIAITEGQKRHLRDLRHHVPEKMNEESVLAVADGGCKIATDWAVPYPRLPDLFEHFEAVREMLGDMLVVRYGHLGEGHPHFNFIARNPEERRAAEEVDMLMARKAVELGGTISGEHGIGKLKRNQLALQYPDSVIEVMRAVKASLDPFGILAPGNIFE